MSSISSYYYATDKDIFDLLTSNQKRITENVLLDYARRRGIFLSQEDSRESLIQYLSLLPYDYYGVLSLCEHTGQTHRKESIKPTIVESNVTADALMRIVTEVRSERAEPNGESYNFSSPNLETILDVEVSYSEVDFSKTRLKQRSQKNTKIEIESRNGEIIIRSPSNPKSDEIAEAIISKLQGATGERTEKRCIDLSGIQSPQTRSQFFLNLIRNIIGFTLHDVTRVSVDRFIDDSPVPVADNDEPDEDEVTSEETEMLGIVRKVLLQGGGLLHSQEFQDLSQRGFFIGKILWLADEDNLTGRRIEFEAGFNDSINGTGFHYSIKGMMTRKRDGNLTKAHKQCEREEERRLNSLLENAAYNALTSLESLTGVGGD